MIEHRERPGRDKDTTARQVDLSSPRPPSMAWAAQTSRAKLTVTTPQAGTLPDKTPSDEATKACVEEFPRTFRAFWKSTRGWRTRRGEGVAAHAEADLASLGKDLALLDSLVDRRVREALEEATWRLERSVEERLARSREEHAETLREAVREALRELAPQASLPQGASRQCSADKGELHATLAEMQTMLLELKPWLGAEAGALVAPLRAEVAELRERLAAPSPPVAGSPGPEGGRVVP